MLIQVYGYDPGNNHFHYDHNHGPDLHKQFQLENMRILKVHVSVAGELPRKILAKLVYRPKSDNLSYIDIPEWKRGFL